MRPAKPKATQLRAVGEARLGAALRDLRCCSEAGSHQRRETYLSNFGLRDLQTGPGTAMSGGRPQLWRAGGSVAVFQRLRRSPGAFESLYGDLRHFFFAPIERSTAACL